MHQRFKISHYSHSGRLRPHEYTSYPLLFLLLLVVGFALTICTVVAATPYNGPESGAVALSGEMPGPAPKTAAVINKPLSLEHFSTSPITIAGTCPADSLVELYKNDIFAGSTPCKSDSTFSLDIDLLVGQNKLIARVYNSLGEAGPDSSPVTAFYDASLPQAAGQAPLNISTAQLLLNTDAVYRGVFPGQEFSIPVDVIGGQAPYAIDVQWGDSTNKIVPRNDNLTFSVPHTYQRAGTYQITLQATDAQDRVAFLTVAAIVNGQPAPPPAAGGDTTGKAAMSKLLVLWPLYAIAATMVVSFWMGERREKRILGGPYLTLHPQG